MGSNLTRGTWEKSQVLRAGVSDDFPRGFQSLLHSRICPFYMSKINFERDVKLDKNV